MMAHRIQLRGTNVSFQAHDDESILAAAMRADVILPHNCQAGGCGTCRIELIDGRVRYDEFPLALSPEEASQGYALACQAIPESDLVVGVTRAPVGAAPARHAAVVRAVRALADDVRHVILEPQTGAPIAYLPGQYLNVVLEDGSRRSFSMASSPRAGLIDIHIRRIAGGRFTDRALARLAAGDSIEIELPHGAFRLFAEDYRPIVMVATGTGLAPLKSMLETLMDDPDCPPVALYWGARRKSDLYLDEEIQAWGARLYEFRYVPVLSRAGADWQGARGYVQDAVLRDFRELSEQSIYLCGSPAMITDARRAFLARGASPRHIYVEAFIAAEPKPIPA